MSILLIYCSKVVNKHVITYYLLFYVFGALISQCVLEKGITNMYLRNLFVLCFEMSTNTYCFNYKYN